MPEETISGLKTFSFGPRTLPASSGAHLPSKVSLRYYNPAGDFIVQSADRTRLRVSATRLRGASGVFKDLMDSSSSQMDEVENLPFVKVSDKDEDIGLFLRYALDATYAMQMLDLETATKILTMCDKYDAQLTATHVVSLLYDHARDDSPTVFALAAMCGHLPMARRALKCFHKTTRVEYIGPKSFGLLSQCNGSTRPGSEARLSTIPRDLFLRIPLAALYNYHKLYDMVFYDALLLANTPNLQARWESYVDLFYTVRLQFLCASTLGYQLI